MLFYISDDIVKKVQQGDSDIIDVLSSLGYFWRTGLCLVDGKRKSLELLTTITELKENYQLILKNKQNVVALYKEIDFFVVLKATNTRTKTYIEGAAGTPVSIYEFKNRIKFGLNIVLCENICDFDFYNWGVSLFGNIDGGVFHLNVFGYNGGGDTTVISARHIKEFPCLIICDNDKKYPEDDEGKTSRDLSTYYKCEGPLMTWLYKLKVHETENLIPYCLLKKVFGSQGLINKMTKLQSDSNYGYFFSFFDFKEGFKPSTLRKMRIENAGSFASYCTFLGLLGVMPEKIKRTLASNYQKREVPLIHGLGCETLKDVINYLSSNYVTCDFDNYQKDDWINIIRKIWSIGCANNPRRL